MAKKNIRILSLEQITALFKELGEPAFRAKQLYDWLWSKRAINFDEMTNFSLGLREKLKADFDIHAVEIHDLQISRDKTIKCAMKLHDNYVVESVLIPQGERMTACISSQVGCSLTCKFCATAKLKRMRNLTADEIYDQVVLVKNTAMEKYNESLSNIV
jgi:23S rRNA (adenine2503-C2)-methyltransferase